MLIGTVACRVAQKIVPHIRLASVLLASETANNTQRALVHSKCTEQLASSTAVTSAASTRVAQKFGAAAHGLSACISAYAGRPCDISRPWDLVITAAAGFATNGSTGGAAGKARKFDRRSKAGRLSSKGRNVKLINMDITNCASVLQLQQLAQRDGTHMDYINLAAAIVKLQKLLSNLNTHQQQQVTQQSASLLDQLWQLLLSKLPQCGVRQLANMTYSVCLLPTPLQQQYQWVVTQQLLPAFERQVSSASPQHVSNVLYGLAASGQQLPEKTTQVLVDQLVAVLRNANTQAIANALWAVANMQQQIQPVQLQQLLEAFCAATQKATPQAIAITLWAVAKVQQQAESGQLATQLEHLLCAFVMQLGDAAPQAVSNTLLACAEFRYLPKQLLTAAGFNDKLAAAQPQALANTAWACAQLGYKDEQLMSALLSHVLDLVGTGKRHLISSGVNAQTLANVCWSLAVLDLREHASAVLTLVQAGKALWASMPPEGFSQLYQSHMWLIDHSLAGGQGLAGVLTAQQLQQCQSTWQEQLGKRARMHVTTFQQSVFDAFQRLPMKWLVPPAMQQVSRGGDGEPDGATLIDITARTADEVWLAVEADGPTHFRQPDRGLMGPTLYRNRALAVRGYVLISVPLYEWNKQRSGKCKQQYLLNKVTAALQQAAVDRPHLQLEEVAELQGVPRHQPSNSNSSQSRSAGRKFSQSDKGNPSNAGGDDFDQSKTSSRASGSVDSGNTNSQD